MSQYMIVGAVCGRRTRRHMWADSAQGAQRCAVRAFDRIDYVLPMRPR